MPQNDVKNASLEQCCGARHNTSISASGVWTLTKHGERRTAKGEWRCKYGGQAGGRADRRAGAVRQVFLPAIFLESGILYFQVYDTMKCVCVQYEYKYKCVDCE